MKAIVFGGSGFLGSHVADYLSAQGHAVAVFDQQPSPYLRPGQTMITGDIRDRDAVLAAVAGAEVVLNFAGYSDIAECGQQPAAALETNVIGNTNIIEACLQHGVKRYCFASTLYVYSNQGGFYRCTKQCCELIIEAYHEARGLEYTILRYGSLYGPRAGEANWISSMLRQALREKKIFRASAGDELREYIHVTDAAAATGEILGADYANQYVILSGAQRIKIRNLMVMVREMLENKVELVFDPDAPGAAEHYEMTPYVFRPRLGKKFVLNPHVELGQGMLDLLHRLHEEEQARG